MVSVSGASASTSRPPSRSGGRSRSQSRSQSRNDVPMDGQQHQDGFSMDDDAFCNSFWGTREEPGQERAYEALMSRVKNANKMLDDFRAFFKERAAIEDDYARRMAKLARMPLGKDEHGELTNVLKRVQYELDQSGRCHNELANVIRQTMENRVREFENTRDARRKNIQGAVERSWKNKQNQEGLVQKAMEKYKSDCILINSFSARLALTQGKDLDKVTQKLDKAQQTVQMNEAEYKQYCRALKESHTSWVGEWKSWCDLTQDLEEERIEFVRNALWSYVNAVSLLCVKDDESCENVRQSIELCDVKKDMAGFIHREGAANWIQDPPHFVDFSDGDKGAAPPAIQPAKFARSSAKVDQAPFDGLEKLQAAVYPQQQQRTGNRSGAATPGAASAISANHTGGAPSAQQQQTPAQNLPPVQSRTPAPKSRPTSGIDTTPQAPQQQRPASPTKRGSASMGSNLPPSASQPQPPAMFEVGSSRADTERSRSRPPSRADNSAQEERLSSEPPSTTAEKLQHMASQKRLSAAAFRTTASPANPASPHYPYASSSPRQAEPYRPPPDGARLPESASAAAAISPAAPPPVAKKEEDPLLAALAKLRNPSSAVDVLSPTSPGIPSNMPSIGRAAGQQQRSQSPYMQQPSQANAYEGRRSPSQPIPHKQFTGPGSAAALAASSSHSPAIRSQTTNDLSHSSMRGPPSQYTGPGTPGNQYGQQARSRPASPQPPSQDQQTQYRAPSPAAAMMRPPSRAAEAPVNYGQALPGERRQSIAPPNVAQHPSQSRPASPAPATGGLRSPPPASGGYAGAGAHGMRSPSPGPGYGHSHSGSIPNARPTSAYGQQLIGTAGRHQTSNSYSGQGPPANGQQPARSTTPIGIALDAHGQVTQDQLAEQYAASQHAQQPQQYGRPPSAAPQHQGYQPQQHPQQQSPYQASPSQAQSPQAGQSAAYRRGASIQRQAQAAQQNRLSQGPGSASPAPGMVTSPSAPMYVQNPSQSPAPQGQPYQQGGYAHPVQPQQQMGQSMQRPLSQNVHRVQSVGSGMNAPPQQGYSQGMPPQQYQSQQQLYQSGPPPQQQMQPQRQPTQSQHPANYGGPAPSYSMPPQQSQQPSYQQPQQAMHASQGRPSPAPTVPPTKQYSDSGQPIQFYVRAIYKYDAQSPEEFSFQKDDVLAVTETEEDGWWHGFVVGTEGSGRSGGDIFPSNFVTLLE